MTEGLRRHYLFDTGPLLAFAAAPGGPALVKARYHGRAGAITDVDRELQGLTRRNQRPVADAAQIALRQFTWIERHSITDEAGLLEVQQLQLRLQTFKPERRRIPPGAINRQDWGECATLLLAKRLRQQGAELVVVVANEDAGRALANADGVPTVSAEQILRAAVGDGSLPKAKAYKMYRAMVSKGIDAGGVIKSRDDL